MTAGTPNPIHRRRWFRQGWPLALLLSAWLIAPLRAGALYPGMPCTAHADTIFRLLSSTLLFIPAAIVLLLLARLIRRAMARGLRVWVIGLGAASIGIGAAYLAFGGISVSDPEQAIQCPAGSPDFQPLHCWRSGSTLEMNASGRRPLNISSVDSLARSLAAVKQDAALYEAIVLDTTDSAIAAYSNARLFVLQRPDLTGWHDLCLSEHRSKQQEVFSHRVGFYRYSAQQSPPVNAFFLQDAGKNGEYGFEVVDFLHGGRTLPYVRPDDLQPAESSYLDRVSAGLTTLNQDLDHETQTPAPAGALTAMRRDFERLKQDLMGSAPPRLSAYRDQRLARFLDNYELILTAEESAAQGQSALKIHSSAYEQHRRYYFQEPRVTRLVGYLYLQQPGQSFTDDDLSTVNWAVF
ncbi:MAG: hypothetical protein PVSMB9_00090 [Candidatus Dormibacteria bacterium]